MAKLLVICGEDNFVQIPIEELTGDLIIIAGEEAPPILWIDRGKHSVFTHLFNYPGGEIILISISDYFFSSYPIEFLDPDDVYTYDDWEFGRLLLEKVLKDPPVFGSRSKALEFARN